MGHSKGPIAGMTLSDPLPVVVEGNLIEPLHDNDDVFDAARWFDDGSLGNFSNTPARVTPFPNKSQHCLLLYGRLGSGRSIRFSRFLLTSISDWNRSKAPNAET